MEDEIVEQLNDWLLEIDTNGFSVSVDIQDGKLILKLTYKTGDSIDEPYEEFPPDDSIINTLKENGWSVETEGTMNYYHLLICPKCGIVPEKECKQRGNLMVHKCGSEIVDYVRGAKWIYGTKIIPIRGNETLDDLKELIEKELDKIL